MKNQPPCIEWADKIGLRHEDLSSQERLSLHEHLQTCEFCRNAQQDYNFLTERIHALPPPLVKPLPRLSLQLDEQVYTDGMMDQAVDHHAVIKHRPYKSLLPAVALLACAVILPLLSLLLFQYRASRNASLGVQVSIGRNLAIYNDHSNWVHTLVWSGDGKTIASIGDDYTVHVWNAKTAKTLFTTRAGSPSAVTLSPDGKEIAFVKEDQADTFVVKDISSEKETFTCKGAGTSIFILAWSPDGQTIVSADDKGTVQFWSVSEKKSLFTQPYNSLTALAWSPDSTRLVLANFQGEVQVWNVQDGRIITKYTGHNTNSVSSVTWSPDGTSIASASIDNTVHVWDARNRQTLFVYKGHTAPVSTVAWSPDGNRIASGSQDGTVQIWGALTGNHPYVYKGHTSPVSSVAWSPDGIYIASCADKTINVWSSS
jgi:Tol biopolymer transport system component